MNKHFRIQTSQVKFAKSPISKSNSQNESIWNREIQLGSAFGLKEKKAFYELLGILLKAGLGILEAFEVIIEQTRSKKQAAILKGITEGLRDGSTFSDSLREQPNAFDSFEIYSIEMGEAGGRLQEVLLELSKHYESRLKIQRKLVQVSSYPLVVIVLAIGVVYFMVTQVVPMFEGVFKQFDAKLPYITQKILDLSFFVQDYGLRMFGGMIAFFLILFRLRKTVTFRKYSSNLLLRIPGIGRLILKIQLARFAISMATLLKSKVNLDEALSIAEGVVRFYPLQIIIPKIKQHLTEGGSFYEAIEHESLFPAVFKQMIRVGERAAKLDEMFENLGRSLEEESEAEISGLTTILEPLLVLILGSIVGTILVSMYLPMFQLSQSIQF